MAQLSPAVEIISSNRNYSCSRDLPNSTLWRSALETTDECGAELSVLALDTLNGVTLTRLGPQATTKPAWDKSLIKGVGRWKKSELAWGQTDRKLGSTGNQGCRKTISLVTLNCKNVKTNFQYVKDLQRSSDIIFLQETWLGANEDTKYLENKSFNIHAHSSMPNGYIQDGGRPFGGTMWLVRDKIKHAVHFHSDRISEIKLDDILIIGVYMMFNDGTRAAIEEMQANLSEIDEIIKNTDKEKIGIIGDFNSDIQRNSNPNPFDKVLIDWIGKNNFVVCDQVFTQRIDHTYASGKGKSWIDHIIVNDKFASLIQQTNIEIDPINTSDHHALRVEFVNNVNNVYTKKRNQDKCRKLDWNSRYIREEYERNVNTELSKIDTNKIINASQTDIVEKLEDICQEMYSALKTAEANTQTNVNKKRRHMKRKSWWDDEMTYLRQQISQAYIRYRDTGFLSEQYKNDLKKIRTHFRYKQRQKIKLGKVRTIKNLERLYRLDRNEFWKEMNRSNKNKAKKVKIGIDKLKETFYDLFNNKIVENQNKEHEDKIKTEVEYYIDKIGKDSIDYELDASVLIMILKTLRNNKSIGHAGISNEMYKNAGEQYLPFLLKCIIEKIFQYGIIPKNFNIGKINPIIKDNKLPSDDLNNIRPITISDTLANIFEKVVLYELEKTQKDHELQFGFKRNSSCNHAIFVLKETVNFYNCKLKSVYACAVDASKAFDKINRLAMMHKLIPKLEACIWRAVYMYYNMSFAYVVNEDEVSERFRTTTGVKQGGPLSPRLFSIYVEALIEELESTELGTEIEGIKTGVIMYADDLVVMSDSVEKLQKMLQIIEKYCEKWEIKINGKKTQYMEFTLRKNGEKPEASLMLGGEVVEKVDKMKYLGVWIDSKLNPKEQINDKKVSSLRAFNKLRNVGIADRQTSPNMKCFLFKVYCRPILHYGIENLTLTATDIKKIQTAEANMIKYSVNVSKRTRSTKLLEAMRIESTSNRVATIKLKFYLRLQNNELTNSIIEKLLAITESNTNSRLLKRSLIGEVREMLGDNFFDSNLRNKAIRQMIKDIRKEEVRKQDSGNCGIVDSIRTCLHCIANTRSNSKKNKTKLVKDTENVKTQEKEINYVKLLKLMLKSFEQRPQTSKQKAQHKKKKKDIQTKSTLT